MLMRKKELVRVTKLRVEEVAEPSCGVAWQMTDGAISSTSERWPMALYGVVWPAMGALDRV